MKLSEGWPDRRKACRVTLHGFSGWEETLKKAYLQRRKPHYAMRWHYVSGSYSAGINDEWEYLEAREKKQ